MERLIRQQTNEIDCLRAKEPERPSDNPLYQNSVSRKAIELRQSIEAFKGDYPESETTKNLIRMTLAGSTVEPIGEDEYEEEDIEEYLNWLNERDEWNKRYSEVYDNYIYTDNFPTMSLVYNHRYSVPQLVLMTGRSLVKAIGIEDSDRLVSEYTNFTTRAFRLPSDDEIEEFCNGVDFDTLRSRLISGGYESYVNVIDDLLENC